MYAFSYGPKGAGASLWVLLVDLEATCSDDNTVPKSARETIEIGAVMVCARTHQTLDEFQAFARPVRYPVLTDFCKNLTRIPQWGGWRRCISRGFCWFSGQEKFRPSYLFHNGEIGRLSVTMHHLFT